jgi:hypothetical protein
MSLLGSVNAKSSQINAPLPVPRPSRRFVWVKRGLIAVGVLACGIVAASLLLTPPLEKPAAGEAAPLPPRELSKAEAAQARLDAIIWPDARLEGTAAKQLLLELVTAGRDRLAAEEGYTATLKRRERIKGKLGPEQTIKLKVRHRPFGVYMRFVEPDAGKEAVYAQGRYDNHVMAHGGGLTRALLPRLKVAPDSPLAMAGNRHPITEAGLLNLANKLVHFRELDMTDDDAGTILDTVRDDQGRTWLRSVHTHTIKTSDRPFMYVEVLYDPQSKLPLQIESYEWSKSGRIEDRELTERYRYDDLDLDAPLTELDFDPANPAYEFHRF